MKNAMSKYNCTRTLLENTSMASLQKRIIAFSDSLATMQNVDLVQAQGKIKSQFTRLKCEIADLSKMQFKENALQSLWVSKISLDAVERSYHLRIKRLLASGERKQTVLTSSSTSSSSSSSSSTLSTETLMKDTP
jgi:hypothetical protein